MFTFGDATVEILRAWRRSKDAVQRDERERDDEQSKSWHRALRRVKERTNERNVKKGAREDGQRQPRDERAGWEVGRRMAMLYMNEGDKNMSWLYRLFAPHPATSVNITETPSLGTTVGSQVASVVLVLHSSMPGTSPGKVSPRCHLRSACGRVCCVHCSS